MFPLFQNHLDVAHGYWQRLIRQGDSVIDATCGNGYDTLALAKMALSTDSGFVYGMDIQPKAITNCRRILEENLSPEQLSKVLLTTGCHSKFPEQIQPGTIRLVAYNLGYLPGGDKALTTMTESTIASLNRAVDLVMPGGAISVTCYPGHTEGGREEDAVYAWAAALDPQQWNCCNHRWINRLKAPALLLVQRYCGTLASF